MNEKKSCLFPECQGIRASRGLCINHYASAAKLIRKGRTTWEYLISKGWAVEGSRSHPTRKDMKGFSSLID